MKKVLTLTLIACGLAFGQEAAAPPPPDPAPIIKALEAENTYLKKAVELLAKKIALMQLYNQNESDIQKNEAAKPSQAPIPLK